MAVAAHAAQSVPRRPRCDRTRLTHADRATPQTQRRPLPPPRPFLPGESIPIRLYLNGFDLTPTYRNIAQKYSVRYYLNLVLVDEEERRYFKQQEITLYRRELG